MSGIFFGIFAAAVLVIIWWYVQNERIGPDSDGDRGLLAMRTSANAATKPGSNDGRQASRVRRAQ